MSEIHFALRELFETKTYPHARTLRTSFSQKLSDTFYALSGGVTKKPRARHVGIFDYLTLYIPAGLLALLGWCYNRSNDNLLAKVLFIPVAFINGPLIILRVAFSAAVTILFSIPIAIVHAFSSFAANESHKNALNLVGTLEKGKEQSLSEYLKDNRIDIEKLDITIKQKESSKYQLMFRKEVTDKPTSSPSEEISEPTPPPFSVEINQKNKPNIHALFKLNVGNIVTHIEESNTMDEQEKQCILTI